MGIEVSAKYCKGCLKTCSHDDFPCVKHGALIFQVARQQQALG